MKRSDFRMKWLGILLIAIGVFLGLYLGLWVCFIGGIVQIVNEFKAAREVIPMNIAFGILRIFFACIVGWISGLALVIPGFAVFVKSKKK